MIKYHVRFTHQYQKPQRFDDVNSSSAIQYITNTVNTIWELEEWVNVFTYIYSNYQVVGSVTVTKIFTVEKEIKP